MKQIINPNPSYKKPIERSMIFILMCFLASLFVACGAGSSDERSLEQGLADAAVGDENIILREQEREKAKKEGREFIDVSTPLTQEQIKENEKKEAESWKKAYYQFGPGAPKKIIEKKTDETALSVDEAAVPPGFVFMTGNDFEVFNNGTTPTFSIDQTYSVTELWSYHYNEGKGALEGGTLSIVSSDGKTYGPWQVEVRNNVYWVAQINMELPAGSYQIIDSDPSTLAQNKESSGQGHAWMYGSPK